MDPTQELKDTENALRDFIALVLGSAFGPGWAEKSGVSLERLQRWQERKTVEEKRQISGVVDERIIYYADFYDLRTILKKHWQLFSVALGDWKSMDVWLSELERLRDPDAHRRELLPHQVHMILGIGGEIRTRIVKYRSKQETEADYFPRIESARDNLGNIWVPGEQRGISIHTNNKLRPGDKLDFVITATDPLGEKLRYGIGVGFPGSVDWGESSTFQVLITKEHISSSFQIGLYIASSREYHAQSSWDQFVLFNYSVLPPMR